MKVLQPHVYHYHFGGDLHYSTSYGAYYGVADSCVAVYDIILAYPRYNYGVFTVHSEQQYKHLARERYRHEVKPLRQKRNDNPKRTKDPTKPQYNRPQSDQRLLHVPLNPKKSPLQQRRQLCKEVPRQINRGVIATHALVHRLTRLGNATILDSHGLPAVLVRHDTVRQGKNGLGLAIVGETTATRGGGRGCGVIEGDLAVAGGVLGAGAGGALLVGGGFEGSGEGGSGEGTEEEKGLEDGGHFVCCLSGYISEYICKIERMVDVRSTVEIDIQMKE